MKATKPSPRNRACPQHLRGTRPHVAENCTWLCLPEQVLDYLRNGSLVLPQSFHERERYARDIAIACTVLAAQKLGRSLDSSTQPEVGGGAVRAAWPPAPADATLAVDHAAAAGGGERRGERRRASRDNDGLPRDAGLWEGRPVGAQVPEARQDPRVRAARHVPRGRRHSSVKIHHHLGTCLAINIPLQHVLVLPVCLNPYALMCSSRCSETRSTSRATPPARTATQTRATRRASS